MLYADLPHGLSEDQEQIERIERQQDFESHQLDAEQKAQTDSQVHGSHRQGAEKGRLLPEREVAKDQVSQKCHRSDRHNSGERPRGNGCVELIIVQDYRPVSQTDTGHTDILHGQMA